MCLFSLAFQMNITDVTDITADTGRRDPLRLLGTAWDLKRANVPNALPFKTLFLLIFSAIWDIWDSHMVRFARFTFERTNRAYGPPPARDNCCGLLFVPPSLQPVFQERDFLFRERCERGRRWRGDASLLHAGLSHMGRWPPHPAAEPVLGLAEGKTRGRPPSPRRGEEEPASTPHLLSPRGEVAILSSELVEGAKGSR